MFRMVEDLQRRHNVPARIRGRVIVEGKPGEIKGAWSPDLLIVRHDGEKISRLCHPVDDVEYAEA